MLLKIAQLQKSAKKYPTKQQINIQRTKKIPPPQKKKPKNPTLTKQTKNYQRQRET